MKHTLYVPDDLADALAESDLKLNLSSLLQTAIRRELAMDAILTDTEGFTRTVIYSKEEQRKIAFQGRQVGAYWEVIVHLTPKGAFVVEDRPNSAYAIYPTFDDLANNSIANGILLAQVAASTGTQYIEDLDI